MTTRRIIHDRDEPSDAAPGRASPAVRDPGWNRPIVAGLIALALASVFVVARLASYDWNPTGFVHAGSRFVEASSAPEDLLIRQNEVGFDGTGFYRLALHPFTQTPTDFGIELDLPAFRQQRIVYPFLAWAASGGGQPSAVGWALIGVNLAAMGAVGWIGGALAVALGRRALWGLLLPLYPGFAIALGLDTAEIVAAALALAGVLLIVKQRYLGATTALTIAMLTRETTLLVPIGIGLAWLVGGVRRNASEGGTPAFVFVIPGAVYLGWQAVLRARWGEIALGQGSDVDLAAPFWGLGVAAPGWPESDGLQATYHFILVASMIAFVAFVIRAARRDAVPPFAALGFAAATVLATLYSEAIWLHHWGFLRAFTEAYLLGAVMLLASRVELRRPTVGAGALWVSLGVNLVAHP